MRRAAPKSLAVIFFLLWSPLAMSQNRAPTGSIIGQPDVAEGVPDVHDKTDDKQLLRAFGKCAAYRNLGLARELLAQLPGSEKEGEVADDLAINACLSSGQVRFEQTVLRPIIAEYLLHRAERLSPSDIADREMYAIPQQADLSKLNVVERAGVSLVMFGQCVATRDLDAVTALLGTNPGSDEELAKFAALRPVFGKCAEQGVSFKLDRFLLRGYLAEGAYRVRVNQAKESGRAQG